MQWFALGPSTLEIIGRCRRCESEVAPSRLFLHYIAGKNMWGKNMRDVWKEFSVAIALDPISIFCWTFFLQDDQRGRIEHQVTE